MNRGVSDVNTSDDEFLRTTVRAAAGAGNDEPTSSDASQSASSHGSSVNSLEWDGLHDTNRMLTPDSSHYYSDSEFLIDGEPLFSDDGS